MTNQTLSWLYCLQKSPIFQRPHHLTNWIRKFGDKVVWYSHPRSLFGILKDMEIGILISPFRGGAKIIEEFQPENKFKVERIISSGYFPLPQKWLPDNFKKKLRLGFLSQVKNLVSPDIVLISWAFLKSEVELFRRMFPKAKIIFDVMDFIPAFHPYEKYLQEAFYDSLKEADGITFINHTLVEELEKFISAPFKVIPNGVQFNESPGFAIKEGKIKKIGYFGFFANWMDFELLMQVVKELNDTHFVLVGPWESGLEDKKRKLMKFKNLDYRGAIPFSQIPQFLREIDLLLIPWLNNSISRFADPIKIKEALYAGLPVIYTLPTKDPFIDSRITILSEAEDICTVIRESQFADKKIRLQWAQEIANNYSWEKLSEEFRKFCISLLY